MRNEMLQEMEEWMEAGKAMELTEIETRIAAGTVSNTDAEEEKNAVAESAKRKSDELRSIFALADPQNMQQRVCNPGYGFYSKHS